MVLKEEINYNIETVRKKDGTTVPIAYIDPRTSQSVYDFKDDLKNKFGAKWDKFKKRWYWWLSNDKAQTQYIIDNQIKPAIEYTTSVETTQDNQPRLPENIQAELEKLISELDGIINAPVDNSTGEPVFESGDDIKQKMEQLKGELVKITTSEEFKALLGPIIKFRAAMGHAFSFSNTILIYVQDKKARMVKSRSNWANANRSVNPDAKAIWLYVPVGRVDKNLMKDEQEIVNSFLKSVFKTRVEDLTPGEEERLRIKKKQNGFAVHGYKLVPAFYDIRFTTQMEGKEDKVGDPDAINTIKWFDGTSEETEKTRKLYDIMIDIIKASTIKVGFVNDMGGARGVSKSGAIDILQDVPKNIGTVNTLIHEFSHELLHQTYLQSTNEELKSYFVGKKEGRGVVEQQAELCSWIVLNSFGYDMPTNINYVGIWGLNADNAVKVFDSVAKVAEYIINQINNRMKPQLKESMMPQRQITGLDVAKLCGEEAVEAYMQGKQAEQIQQTQMRIQEMFKRVDNPKDTDINTLRK